jgi:hypothetical protein
MFRMPGVSQLPEMVGRVGCRYAYLYQETTGVNVHPEPVQAEEAS